MAPKLKFPPAVVVAIENPVGAAVVAGVFVASKESPGATGVTIGLFVRVKLGRFDGVHIGVVKVLPPRLKPAPLVIVVGVPKVKPVIPGKDLKDIIIHIRVYIIYV